MIWNWSDIKPKKNSLKNEGGECCFKEKEKKKKQKIHITSV